MEARRLITKYTKKDENEELTFDWTNGYVSDLTHSNLIRFAIKGPGDSQVAFAEES